MELLYRGAEAEIWKDNWLGIPVVRKIRIKKAYRDQRLDERLRRARTKRESRMLILAREAVNTPHVLDIDLDKNEITIEYVEGEKVRDILYRKENVEKIGKKIGKAVRKMHDTGIIHNDLTTSNFIWDGRLLWIIDFGLAERSKKLEDMAVDLVVFKKMLKASHWEVFDGVWSAFLDGYGARNEIIKKIGEIEKRAKYMR